MRRDVLIGAAVILAAALLFAIFGQSFAHDPTGFWHQQIAEGKAPPAAWWQGLASGKGSCCDHADGVRVEDVDWDTGGPNGQYRVRLRGEWIVVPETAVVAVPNRYGPAVVWPYTDTGNTTQIRCFLPGAGA